MTGRALGLAPGLWLACMAGALAQGIDLTQGGPIQITARDGIEWRQGDQVVIANGDAKAVRANVTVTADRLLAWYRRKDNGATSPAGQTANQGPGPGTGPGTSQAASPGAIQGANQNPGQAAGLASDTETEGNEVYRLRAEGNVHVFTATDQAWGDQATYDLDQSVLVMTGSALKLTTPDSTLTARDTLEYWSQKHMAVARGDAVVFTNDARRVAADTLVAFTVDAPATAASPTGAATPPPAPGAGPGGSTGSTAAMAGKLEHVEAFNNVSVRTQTEIVTGDRGVYVPDTGIARLGGNVRITRGPNQVNGAEAVVNMKTGIATLLSGGSSRVSGIVMPNDRSSGVLTGGPAANPAGGKPPGEKPADKPAPVAKPAQGTSP